MKILEVKDVYKRLGRREIIKGISFDVEEGEIFGFLGPNGAGKTTTIRMLVGLIHPNRGSIKICGYNLKKEREKALSSLGAVVENPELYSYLSGKENLMQIARIRKVKEDEINELVELVGLTNRINDKVKKYSLGMKQRLGLAAALISNPRLLILDEPTNGLDPSGILDFREVVKKAAKERGCTVFISSHILHEIQQLCDTVAFINHGVIQAVEKIKGTELHTEAESYVIRTKDNKKALEVLAGNELAISLNEKTEGIVAVLKKDSSTKVISKLIEGGIDIKEFYIKNSILEQRYMELVEGGSRK